MENNTYHVDIFLPKELLFSLPKILNLTWSEHALRATKSDRYGKIIPFYKIILLHNLVVEYSEESGGRKILFRMEYNNQYDISIVVLIKNNLHLVKTVWLNDKNDKHKTLNRSKYVERNKS